MSDKTIYHLENCVYDGEAIMFKEDTSTMVADALTKALNSTLFIRHQRKLTSFIPMTIADKYTQAPVGVPGQDQHYVNDRINSTNYFK